MITATLAYAAIIGTVVILVAGFVGWKRKQRGEMGGVGGASSGSGGQARGKTPRDTPVE